MASKRKPRARRNRTEQTLVESGYKIPDHQVEALLASGDHAEYLRALFGSDDYDELRQLAAEAALRRARGGQRVVILPGTMGSKLGTDRFFGLFQDTLWFDPLDIAQGKLRRMTIPSDPALRPIGVILFAYLKLKFRLVIAGFDCIFFPYDWRDDILVNADKLADALLRDSAEDIALVGHSQGGLLARAALHLIEHNEAKVARVILLGTPNHGTLAGLGALRGTDPVVQYLAVLDLLNDATTLAEDVFSTYPALYQMLPPAEQIGGLDLFDVASWPTQGPPPDADILPASADLEADLAPADDRFVNIIGINRTTPVNVERTDAEFVYTYSDDGDGTVSRAMCHLENCRSYFTDTRHGSMGNSLTVANAVIDLIGSGTTDKLPTTPFLRTRAVRQVREATLREAVDTTQRASDLTHDERRAAIATFASPEADDPPTQDLAAGGGVGTGFGHPFEQVVVGRRRQRQLEIRLAHGTITEADTRALVLGVFLGVDPSGAAAAIDAQIGGAVREFTARRMFSGRNGDVFILPTGRSRIRAEMVLFAGLGMFDDFNGDAQEYVAGNVMRTFLHSNVEEFATVIVGGGSGLNLEASVRHHLKGFLDALVDADGDRRFRRVTICELDDARFGIIKKEVYRLASTPLFDEFQVVFDEVRLEEPPIPPVRRAVLLESAAPIYLIVRREPGTRYYTYRTSVLGVGNKATVMTETCRISTGTLQKALQRLNDRTLDPVGLDDIGAELADLVLGERTREALKAGRDRHLVIVHDREATRVPWETIRIDDWSPGFEEGISRRYAADNLAVAKWLEQRRLTDTLEMLLITNPTGDLDGARTEATEIKKLFSTTSAVRITELAEKAATWNAVESAFRSGRFDVVHYAGHAEFDSRQPGNSGILCAGGKLLSGSQLARLTSLPALAVFNACEAGRVRANRRFRQGGDERQPKTLEEAIQRNVSLAEAFLRGGVANYIGTYWSVGDATAATFSGTLYEMLLNGSRIGQAIQSARRAVYNRHDSVDWADYIHFGNHDFVIKQR